jgi:hypothetical protein
MAGDHVDAVSMIEILSERESGGFGFTMRTTANAHLHRVLPLRDPDQPRFWCVVVVRCTPGGLPDRAEPAWIGLRGLRREELAATMGAIRADVPGWLAEPAQAQLRAWVLAAAEETSVADVAREGARLEG